MYFGDQPSDDNIGSVPSDLDESKISEENSENSDYSESSELRSTALPA